MSHETRLPIRPYLDVAGELKAGELNADYLRGAIDGLKAFADILVLDRALVEHDDEPPLSVVLELLALSTRKLEAIEE